MDLFDDNSSFFSNTNTFPHSYFKLDQQAQQQLGNVSQLGANNSPQLPDLLNGTETNNKDRIDIDKLNLLKELGGFNVQSGYGGTSGKWLQRVNGVFSTDCFWFVVINSTYLANTQSKTGRRSNMR